MVRAITNPADPDASLACEYHDYYNGWSLIEMRNENNRVLKQMVWGTQYIDELVQVGVNPDPAAADEQHCDAFYYALTGSNFSIMGITDASGELVQRYAYTPYGQRQVFVPVDAADTLCLKLAGLSTRVEIEGAPDTYHPYGLCEFGHQGLLHDEAAGGVDNRRRYYLPPLGRFAQADPWMANPDIPTPGDGYQDGMNHYEYIRTRPVIYYDPYGLSKRYKKSGTTSVFSSRRGYGFARISWEMKWDCSKNNEPIRDDVKQTNFSTTSLSGYTLLVWGREYWGDQWGEEKEPEDCKCGSKQDIIIHVEWWMKEKIAVGIGIQGYDASIPIYSWPHKLGSAKETVTLECCLDDEDGK